MRIKRNAGGSQRIKRFCAKETSLSGVRRCSDIIIFSVDSDRTCPLQYN
jgi:hypothetical protein